MIFQVQLKELENQKIHVDKLFHGFEVEAIENEVKNLFKRNYTIESDEKSDPKFEFRIWLQTPDNKLHDIIYYQVDKEDYNLVSVKSVLSYIASKNPFNYNS